MRQFFNPALEQEQQEEEVKLTPEELAEVDVASNLEATQDVVEEVEAMGEATSAIVATESMINVLTASIEKGVGISTEALTMMSTGLEHFYERAGKDNSKLSAFALESADDANLLEATKVALEEVQAFHTQLQGGLSIAQEGIAARFVNTLKMIFTSEEKIRERILDAQKQAKANGTKEDKVLNTPGWGRSFAVIGKKELDYSDVSAYLKKFGDLVASTELEKLMDDTAGLLTSVANEVSKSRWIANDDAVGNINKLTERMEEFHDRCAKIITKHNVKTAKNDPSFKALSADQVEKLGDQMLKIMNDVKANRARVKFNSAIHAYNERVFLEAFTRLAGVQAKDIRAANHIVMSLNKAISSIIDDYNEFHRVSFAAANYMRASVK